MSLCYRCEYRAQFLEKGHGPRYECGDTQKSMHSCYQYHPVKPLILIKDENDDRPQFGGALFSSRSHSGGLPELKLNLEGAQEGSIIYWTPRVLDELHIKARDMLWFLNYHPALGAPTFDLMSLLNIEIAHVCKRGQTEPLKGEVALYYTPENYKRFKKEFDEELKEYTKEELKLQRPLVSIHVPYEKLHGEKWSPDHIEYWGELDFVAYMGKNFKKGMDRTKWQTLQGINSYGRTFEEMVVNIGTKFKKIFGNFNDDKLMTPFEKENNKGKMPFFFKKINDPKYKNCSTMVRNRKYISISHAEMNRRWLKWFSKTPYCKKNWAKEINDILAGKEAFR